MGLSTDLITQFVKATKNNTKTKKESTVYGTAVEYNGKMYARLDGSELLTPITATADTKPGERVTLLIKNHSAIVTGNVSSPAARSGDVNDVKNSINNLDIDRISAKVAELDTIIADVAYVKDLDVERARIDTLEAENMTISGTLTAVYADVEYLKANVLTASSLEATNAKIQNLEVGIGRIDTLIFGAASGDTIHTSFSNAVIAQVGNAQIKSAMIESISAGKITAGDIVTNNVRVVSNDGRLLISGDTIQISDNSRVRVQIGKDASNDYSINIWDSHGKLMFSEGGITDSAIKSAIIRNDMVSDNANISANKLNVDSLFTAINGSTNTIKSTKVYLDEKNQTLEVAFRSMDDAVDALGDRVTSQGTEITTIQGYIASKVWQQDIDNATDAMSTRYSTLEQSLNGFKTIVSETYSTKGENEILTNRMSAMEQTAEGLTIDIADAAKTATNYLKYSSSGLVIGDMTSSTLGKNVLIDSDSVDIRNGNTTLASFGADYLYLAKNSRDATIDLCNGLAQMYHTIDERGYSQFNIYTSYGLSSVKISAPMTKPLTLENTGVANGVIVKNTIKGTIIGGYGMLREGYMVRYGNDVNEDDAVAYRIHDEENFGTIDSSWKSGGVIGENFTLYSNDYQIQYRKIGKIVEVRGVVKPTKIITGSADNHTIFTLAEGYRPSEYIYERCQGSGSYSWLLSITTGGIVRFSRYNDGTKYVDASTSSWLPFHVTFFVD